MSNDEGIREDEVTRRRLFVIWTCHWFVVRHSDFVIDVTNPARDWLQGEGPCEILPVVARRPSAGRPRVPAARDSDLNYSQVEKEKTLMRAEQKMGAVS
jgi:hypothetical protein